MLNLIQIANEEAHLDKIRGVLAYLTEKGAYDARSEAFSYLAKLRRGDVESTPEDELAIAKMMKEDDIEGLKDFFKTKNEA